MPVTMYGEMYITLKRIPHTPEGLRDINRRRGHVADHEGEAGWIQSEKLKSGSKMNK